MFGHRFFGARFYGPAYWGDGGTGTPPVVVVPSGGDAGATRGRWFRGVPLQFPWREEEPQQTVRKRITTKLVEDALDAIEVPEINGVPVWWLEQNPKQVRKQLPEFISVPTWVAEDREALLQAIAAFIAKKAEEEEDELMAVLMLA